MMRADGFVGQVIQALARQTPAFQSAPRKGQEVDRRQGRPQLLATATAIVIAITAMAAFVVLLKQTRFAEGAGGTQLVLSTSQVKNGDTYSATARGFLPGEVVKFSWDGGPMADAPPADSGGSTTLPQIVEAAPPGKYTLTARGQTSGRTATAEVRVVTGDRLPP